MTTATTKPPRKRQPRDRKKPKPTITIEPLLVPISGVCALIGLSEAQVRNAIKGGGFPTPLRKCGLVLWPVKELRKWAEQ